VEVPGWPDAFRGSAAIEAGVVTRGRLRGDAFRRAFPDTYVRTTDGPPSPSLRALAAYRWAQGHDAVVSGYSAAELLGASCGPPDVPAEITVPGRSLRVPAGLVVHRDVLAPGEICTLDGVRATSPLRTAFDLARRPDLTAAVVAVDALARVGGFDPDLLLNFGARYRGARGTARLSEVLTLADRRSGSPMETRVRLLLVLAGLPRPEVQFPVLDDLRRRAFWLDLAYPRHRVGIEYEGSHHTTPEQVRRDTSRFTRLVAAGWRMYRYTCDEVHREPDRIVAEITEALRGRG
jgi:hypothetical protein